MAQRGGARLRYDLMGWDPWTYYAVQGPGRKKSGSTEAKRATADKAACLRLCFFVSFVFLFESTRKQDSSSEFQL